MIQIQRFITEVLAEVLRKAPLSDEKLACAWRAAVGPAMDRGTKIALTNGVLRVHAPDAWRREVQRSAALIHARLEGLLGRGVVRTIEVEDDSRPTWKR